MDIWSELDEVEFNPATDGSVAGISENEPLGLTASELATVREYRQQQRDNAIEQADQA